MKNFKRKPLVIAMQAAVLTAAAFLLQPLKRYYERDLCLYDLASGDLKELGIELKSKFEEIQTNIKKSQDETMKALEDVRKEGTLYAKTADEMKKIGEEGAKLGTEFKAIGDRLLEVEQKMAKKHGAGGENETKSIGRIVTDSEEYTLARKGKKRSMDPVTVGSFHKVAILNATLNTTQPLVAPDRSTGLVMPAQQRLTIRDLCPQARTESNLIQFATENVFTNSAAPQGSAGSPTGDTEAQLKAESGITFTNNTSPVITLAHWIPASQQVLDDASMLQSYIEQRLTYGLKLEEEHELLTGDGTNGKLTGLNSSAAAYTQGSTHDTQIDSILKGCLQVSLSFFEADGVVLHPVDWYAILMLKDTQGRYIYGDPSSNQSPRLWGRNVVPTVSQTQGQMTIGAFAMACQIWDNDDANVRISEQHADFFVRNMVAILAEERLAFTVFRPTALVYGALGNSN